MQLKALEIIRESVHPARVTVTIRDKRVITLGSHSAPLRTIPNVLRGHPPGKGLTGHYAGGGCAVVAGAPFDGRPAPRRLSKVAAPSTPAGTSVITAGNSYLQENW